MDPYHHANAPPPYTDHQGQPLPPYAPSYGEKNPSEGPGYQPVPQGRLYPQPEPQYPQPGSSYNQPGQKGPPNPQSGPQYPPLGQQGSPYPHPGQPGPSYAQQPLPPPPTNAYEGQPPIQVVRNIAFGMNPIRIECPACHADIKTRIWRNSSIKTHLIAGLLCVFGCWPCVCVPYCMASCKDTSHKCPNCQHFLGIYKAGS